MFTSVKASVKLVDNIMENDLKDYDRETTVDSLKNLDDIESDMKECSQNMENLQKKFGILRKKLKEKITPNTNTTNWKNWSPTDFLKFV